MVHSYCGMYGGVPPTIPSPLAIDFVAGEARWLAFAQPETRNQKLLYCYFVHLDGNMRKYVCVRFLLQHTIRRPHDRRVDVATEIILIFVHFFFLLLFINFTCCRGISEMLWLDGWMDGLRDGWLFAVCVCVWLLFIIASVDNY